MKQHSGFTLVELMITVAVVAILSALAIPAFRDYVARTQLVEAVNTTTGLKTSVAEAYALLGDASACSIPGTATVTGRYVLTVIATNADADHCDLVATMRPGIAAKISGQTLTATYTPSTGEWRCTTSAATEVKPAACR